MNYSHQSKATLLNTLLAPYVDAFSDHFTRGNYASVTVADYYRCFTRFAHWVKQSSLNIYDINEEVIEQFISTLFPGDASKQKVCHSRHVFHAALGHILVVLRTNEVIPPASIKITLVDQELHYFDHHMNHVRGLATKTRSHYLCVVRRLLLDQFSDQSIVISKIKPEDVRQFINRQKMLFLSSGGISHVISALRGYFRFRITCGDQVNHLIGVACYPANWQLSSLPKTLNNTEVHCLLKAIDHDGSSTLRMKAIVHCALDLGLRSCEVANLRLDDIDWHSAIITLRETKSRRVDTMPLPEATGRALADYLRFERPQIANNRSIFIRTVAPQDRVIGPDLVRKTIRQAYALAGLPYTRSHLLRHTMASRLLEGGSSLKEVADVLRHRSLNTTLIYAKLDSKNLDAVALPWPGSES